MSKYIYDKDSLVKYPLTRTEEMVLGRHHKYENNSPFTTYTVFKQPGWKEEIEELILSEYGFDEITAFQAPYFSITGSTWDNGREGSGGCIHDTLLEVHPPFAELIPYHLVNCFGVPMHYSANADYWMRLHLGISRWNNSDTYNKRPHIEILKDHIHYNEELDGEEFQKHHDNYDTQAFKAWLDSRLPRLRKEMQETMLRWGIDLAAVVLKYQQKQARVIEEKHQYVYSLPVKKEWMLNRVKVEFIDHTLDRVGGIRLTHNIDSTFTDEMPFNITKDSLMKSFGKLHRKWLDSLERKYNVHITTQEGVRGELNYEYRIAGIITGFGNPQDGEEYALIAGSESILVFTCEEVRKATDDLSIDWWRG